MTKKNVLLIGLMAVISFFLFQNLSFESEDQIQYSDFVKLVDNRQIAEAVIQGNKVHYSLDGQKRLTTTVPEGVDDFSGKLFEKGVRIKIQDAEKGNFFLTLLGQWLPILLIIGIWAFAFRSLQGGSKLMNFNQFKVRGGNEKAPECSFEDLAGIDEAIEEVKEVVEYMKEPEKFRRIGGKIPTGILLCGRPGTGKTLLARAMAGEAGIGFLNITGSDFVEMFVGVGAKRVRELFKQASGCAPCIIFIDEIDAVGRSRGSGLGGGNDEREQTLNQLLVEMDGFNGKEGIIIIAATNRPDVLDPALTRPGRFDRTVIVPPPDLKGREKILKIHTRKVKLKRNVDLGVVAKGLPNSTGADLANLVNEAALLAARGNSKKVGMEDFENARDKIMMGSERKTLKMTPKELETTAYHEAGHAIIASLLEECDPLHKVTIVPRGKALGVTMLLPTEDKHSVDKGKILAILQMMMGGRAAEEIVYDHFTTGAGNDLERATKLAHDMVCRWGMSEKIGPLYLNEDNQEVFLGRDMMKKKILSQFTAKLVDDEVRKIVNAAYKQTIDLLKKNKVALDEITSLLLKKETIEGSAVANILKEKGVPA